MTRQISFYLSICSLLAFCKTSFLDANTYTVKIGGPYPTIQSALNVAGDGDTILLTAGQIFTGSNNVNLTISKNLTFDRTTDPGVDPIINGQGSNQLMVIANDVSISNIQFIGGSASDGGALLIESGVTTNLINCNLQQNNATEAGGAIDNAGTLILTGCTLSDNSVTSTNASGGGIMNKGSAILTECILSGNSATSNRGIGGAITNIQASGLTSNLSLNGCTLNGNNAYYGGAINNESLFSGTANLSLYGCTLNGNNAIQGGAIFNQTTGASATLAVHCCRIVANSAASGAAIYNVATGGSTSVNASNNWWGSNDNPSSLFSGMNPPDYTPWLVLNITPSPLIPCQLIPLAADFTKNSAGSTTACTVFDGKWVTFSSTEGTIIPLTSLVVDGRATTTLYDIDSTVPFTVCAIVDQDLGLTYTYCVSAANIAYVSPTGNDTNPGSITAPVKTIAQGIKILKDCGITGTVYLEADSIFTGTGNKAINIINQNVSFDRYGDQSLPNPIIDLELTNRLFAIQSTATVSISHIDIKNGASGGSFGGIITNNGTLTAYVCTFSTSVANSGAALYNDSQGNLTTSDCNFIGNRATEGGVVYNNGLLNVINGCIFSQNQADDSGGCLYNNGSVSVSAGCSFAQNQAHTFGGALYNNGSLTILAGCTFSQNQAHNSGGALYNNVSSTIAASDCTLDGNSADNFGGAIYNDGTTNIHCSRFINNNAILGSAIYKDSGSVDAINNWWGSNDDPSSLLYDIDTSGYTPWLKMTVNANPPNILPGQSSTITADFTKSGTCTIPDGTPVLFTATGGTIFPTSAVTLDGSATATLTSITTNPVACAIVDTATECIVICPIIVDLYGTYTNIQAAVNAASPGCTILLTAGQTFTGDGNKNITIASTDLTFGRTGDGADPIIDMSSIPPSTARLFTIATTATVTISNLDIRNGYRSADSGGAILNSGTLTAYSCTFSGNRANNALGGGAIYNNGTISSATKCIFSGNSTNLYGGAIFNLGTINSVTDCTFSGNSAHEGGVIYNGGTLSSATGCTFRGNSANSGGAISNHNKLTVSCSRFIGNSAAQGNAIYAAAGTVTATNNWWGSNADPGNQFYPVGSVNYTPWIIMALQANPATPWLGGSSTITANFTQNSNGQPIGSCLPDGTPVLFTTTYGTITPAAATTISGTATASLSSDRLATTCAVAGPGAENYQECTIVNSIPQGLYRLNYGCICSDTTGTEHILIGSYNNTGVNQIEGWVFDEVQAICSQISPLILTPDILYNVAVYNEADIINIAVLTTTSNSYNLSLATCSYNGVNFVISPTGTPITLPAAAFKVQWAVAGGNPFIAVDTIDNMRVYPVDLSTYTIGTPIQTPNMGNNQYASDFLYWLYQDNGLFLVQGFNNTNIATYLVDLTGTPTIYPGVVTDVSSTFSFINSCATCFNYFVVGGSAVGQGTLAQYDVNSTGSLNLIRQYPTAGTTVNYCERCCCQESQLLVGTDVGLFNYTIEFDGSLTPTSSLSLPVSGSTNWLNVCWCCNNSNKYCAAVNNAPSAFVLEQMTPTFTTQCSLE